MLSHAHTNKIEAFNSTQELKKELNFCVSESQYHIDKIGEAILDITYHIHRCKHFLSMVDSIKKRLED
jgi:hypothetical protein